MNAVAQTPAAKPTEARQIENLRGALALCGQTIKSLEIVNGGAAVGLLTFYGNVLARHADTAARISPCAIAAAILCFGVGLLLAVVCAGVAYLVQLAIVTEPSNLERERGGIRKAAIVGALSALFFAFGLIFAVASFL